MGHCRSVQLEAPAYALEAVRGNSAIACDRVDGWQTMNGLPCIFIGALGKAANRDAVGVVACSSHR